MRIKVEDKATGRWDFAGSWMALRDAIESVAWDRSEGRVGTCELTLTIQDEWADCDSGHPGGERGANG